MTPFSVLFQFRPFFSSDPFLVPWTDPFLVPVDRPFFSSPIFAGGSRRPSWHSVSFLNFRSLENAVVIYMEKNTNCFVVFAILADCYLISAIEAIKTTTPARLFQEGLNLLACSRSQLKLFVYLRFNVISIHMSIILHTPKQKKRYNNQ